MKTFTDNQKREWRIEITVATVKRVRSLTKVDLLAIFDGELVGKLATNPVLLCDVLYAVCKPQADAADVSDEQFGEALAGEAIDNATTALLGALTDFFPNQPRQTLTRLVTETRYAMAKQHELVGQKFATGAVRKRIDRELQIAADLLTDPPESSESTPEPSRSES